MFKKKIHKSIKIFCLSVFVLISMYLSINIFIVRSTKNQIFNNLDQVDEKQTILVLGAYVYPDGSLSPMLEDRVLTAVELYESGKAEKILVSGDHGQTSYDEVNSIKNYLLDEKIPAEDIFLDHAGFDTYDSIYRAKEIFEVDSLIIVSQDFHLPRATYIANSLNIDNVGFEANRRLYMGTKFQNIRESFARIKAFLNVILGSNPKYLGDKIPITGDSKESWD